MEGFQEDEGTERLHRKEGSPAQFVAGFQQICSSPGKPIDSAQNMSLQEKHQRSLESEHQTDSPPTLSGQSSEIPESFPVPRDVQEDPGGPEPNPTSVLLGQPPEPGQTAIQASKITAETILEFLKNW